MKRLMLLAAALCILFPCCASGPYTATGPDPGERNPEELDTSIYCSSDLTGILKVLNQKAERAPDGRLRVFAHLQNMDDEEIHLLIQTDFKDQDGMSTGDTTNWSHLLLPGYASKTYQQTSMNDKAYKYTIRIRLPEE